MEGETWRNEKRGKYEQLEKIFERTPQKEKKREEKRQMKKNEREKRRKQVGNDKTNHLIIFPGIKSSENKPHYVLL